MSTGGHQNPGVCRVLFHTTHTHKHTPTEWAGEKQTLRSTHIRPHITDECAWRDKHALFRGWWQQFFFSLTGTLFLCLPVFFLSQEIVDKDGQSKVLSFTVPSLSKPSVYHEVRSTFNHAHTHTCNVLLQKHKCKNVFLSLPAFSHRLHGPHGRRFSQPRIEQGGVQRATPAEGDLHSTEQVKTLVGRSWFESSGRLGVCWAGRRWCSGGGLPAPNWQQTSAGPPK